MGKARVRSSEPVKRDWPVGRTTTAAGGALNGGVLVPPLTRVFEDLAVGASLWIDDGWLAIHAEHNLVTFEMQHGVLEERFGYNDRSIRSALKTQKPVLGEHNGFYDLF